MTTTLRTRFAAAVLAGVGLMSMAPLAHAQAGTAAQAARERAVCDGVQQDRAACLREAGAAQQEARRNGLTSGPRGDSNALARCATQPVADRADCEARIRGTGNTTVEGSVMGGGVIRETTTVVPAK